MSCITSCRLGSTSSGTASRRRRSSATYRAGDVDAVARVEEALGDRARERFRLSDAQWLIAREHGYRSWAEFARWVETREPEPPVGRIGRQPVARLRGAGARAARRGLGRATRTRCGACARTCRGSATSAAASSRSRDAKLVVAREYGFPTWRDLTFYVEKAIREHEGQREGADDVLAALDAIRAGDVARLEALLDAQPELVGEVHQGAWTTLLEAIAQPDVVGDGLECELGVDPRVVGCSSSAAARSTGR